MVRFSLATGLRQRNMVELEWSQVDLRQWCAWIYADQAKGRRDIAGEQPCVAQGTQTRGDYGLPLATLDLGELAPTKRHSLDQLQRLGAWRSGKMVERYAALNAADLAEDAERIARSRLRVVTNPATRRTP